MRRSKEIKELLLSHYRMYPVMRIQDTVKLLYQSEFGGGHLGMDEAESLARLRSEYEALPPAAENEQAFVDIGNGLCRLSLKSLKDIGVDIETVNRFFILTLQSVHGNMKNFEASLNALLACCKDGALGFDAAEAKEYLSRYKKNGAPESHSEEYRQAYRPAYRVINAAYRDHIELFARIDSLLRVKDRATVAIDGNSGAGKSALASLISGIYDCNVFHTDDYFLRAEQRTAGRLAEPGGNFDRERFSEEVITGVKSGFAFSYRKFDCGTMTLGVPITVQPKRLNIIEGSYSMHPALLGNYDLKVFIQIGKEEQSTRILKRNGPAMHKRFLREWIPMEDKYFKEMGIKEKCDLVFGETNKNI